MSEKINDVSAERPGAGEAAIALGRAIRRRECLIPIRPLKSEGRKRT